VTGALKLLSSHRLKPATKGTGSQRPSFLFYCGRCKSDACGTAVSTTLRQQASMFPFEGKFAGQSAMRGIPTPEHAKAMQTISAC